MPVPPTTVGTSAVASYPNGTKDEENFETVAMATLCWIYNSRRKRTEFQGVLFLD
jgi:hypothetical protein